MEPRSVIHFLKLKGRRAFAIAAELKPVYETEALAISTVKTWRKRFTDARTSLYDDQKGGRPLVNDFIEAISFMFKERSFLSGKGLCQHFRIAKGTCL
jgi:transposase